MFGCTVHDRLSKRDSTRFQRIQLTLRFESFRDSIYIRDLDVARDGAASCEPFRLRVSSNQIGERLRLFDFLRRSRIRLRAKAFITATRELSA